MLSQSQMIQNKHKIAVFHFISGPSGRKTTLSAGLFYRLKTKGYDAELVPELVKRYIWKMRKSPEKVQVINNQHLMSSKHYKSYHTIVDANEIDAIVLDGSPLNGLWYNRNNPDNTSNVELTERMIIEKFHENADEDTGKVLNVVFYLERMPETPYSERGRIHTESEAKQMDKEILESLERFSIPFVHITSESDEEIFTKALEYL